MKLKWILSLLVVSLFFASFAFAEEKKDTSNVNVVAEPSSTKADTAVVTNAVPVVQCGDQNAKPGAPTAPACSGGASAATGTASSATSGGASQAIGMPANCGKCPEYAPMSADFCKDGKMMEGTVDSCNCKLPPKCFSATTAAAASGGASGGQSPAVGTPATCGECPKYPPSTADFCKDGKMLDGGLDLCGCQLPKKCITIEPTNVQPVTGTGTACGECPKLEPITPDYCKEGKVMEGGVDNCGCQMPPKCIKPETIASTSVAQPTVVISASEPTKTIMIEPTSSSVAVNAEGVETQKPKEGFVATASVAEGQTAKEISISTSGEKVIISTGGMRLGDCMMLTDMCNKGNDQACTKYKIVCLPTETVASAPQVAEANAPIMIEDCMGIKNACDKGAKEACDKFKLACEPKVNETLVAPSVIETSQKVEIKDNKLYMNDKEVKVMPDTASQQAVSTLALKKSVTIQLKDTGTPTYEVTGVKDAKVFAFIPAEMTVKAEVNADTGAVGNIVKPWWAFMATEG